MLKKRILILASFCICFWVNGFTQTCDTVEADFSSNEPQCTGEGVDFVNTGSDYGALTYKWDFGNGASPSGTTGVENPSGITYSSSGLKQVTLTIEDAGLGCVKTKTKGITIHEEPSASIGGPNSACANVGVSFNNNGSTGSKWNYSWDFGSGASPTTSTAENPSGIVYSTEGSKTVTYTVTDDNGNCSASDTKPITIASTPEASFSSSAPECTEIDVDFTNTGSSGGNIDYKWDFGSGASPSDTTGVEDPSGVTYSSSGIKVVRLVTENTSTNCTDTMEKSIKINKNPSVNFNPSANPICEGAKVDFTNTGSSGSEWNYQWDFGSGADPSTSTTENPRGVTYSTAGTKTVTLTITDDNNNCSSTSTMNITVNNTPDALFSSTAPECTGIGVDFTNDGSSGMNLTYDWDFGNGADPTDTLAENPSGVTYSTAGTKLVRLITTDTSTGCADTMEKDIQIHLTPDVGFATDTPKCAKSDVDFT
ncbi:MAG: PKD domain-containing protein, partial [Flavobacteriales bacterium]